MNLANPQALALLALALPVALLYLIRVKPRELAVGTDQFWEQVFAEQSYRTAWQRLRDVASLLVQLALLALLVGALAEPIWTSDSKEARRVVLVVDQSSSMNALDGSPTRLDSARGEARRVISELRGDDQASLIVAGLEPRVACGLTGDRRVLTRSLDLIGPSEGPSRLALAVDLARVVLAGHPRGRIEIFSDGCGEGVLPLLKGPDVALHPVGRRTGNVGITRFQVRRSLNDLAGYQVFIEVGNFSDAPVDCQLDLERDGLTSDVLPLSLKAGETWRTILDKVSTGGGRLLAKLDLDDALAADNRAWAILPPRDPLPVTLVEPGGRFDDLYLEKVLEANPLVRQPAAILSGGEPPSKPEAGEVRIYHRKVPDRLPPGPTIVVDPREPCDLWDVGEPVTGLVVGTQDRTSPLLAFVKLENVSLVEAQGIRPKAKAEVLASFVNGEPLIATFRRPEGNVVVVAASLDDPADLPLRTAFPILMGNALAWLDLRRDDLRPSTEAGNVVELTGVPSGTKVWSPGALESPSSRVGDALTIGPLDACGIWRVASSREGPAFAEVACNLASPLESDLRPSKDLPSPPSSARLAVPGIGVPWFALIVAAWTLAVVEWRLYQRRWIS